MLSGDAPAERTPLRMPTASLTVDPAFRVGPLDRRLFGTFVLREGRRGGEDECAERDGAANECRDAHDVKTSPKALKAAVDAALA